MEDVLLADLDWQIFKLNFACKFLKNIVWLMIEISKILIDYTFNFKEAVKS